MSFRSLSIQLFSLYCIICGFIAMETEAVWADEGIPEELQREPSNGSLAGELKDNQWQSEKPPKMEKNGVALQGRADVNVNRAPQMPPLAPPIRQRPPVDPYYFREAPIQPRPMMQRPPPPQYNRPLQNQVPQSGSVLNRVFGLGANRFGSAASKIERPSWIPAHAYTNDSMVAPYHNRDIIWWDKRPMPNKPQWVILSTSVTKYWRGYAPNPCWILVSPNPLAPGNFTFRSRVRRGPRGWLQATQEKSKFGFPLYRYWFDRP